jgi:predicted transposase/invertase (TIGR01784 family)
VFFRSAFGIPDHARELVRLALPARITRRLDLGAIQIQPGSFVGPGHRPYYSDLLLQTTTRGRWPLLVYILFEHKSSPDRRTLYQLLRYMVGIWDRWTSRKENRRWRHLPPIIPVVFSHSGRRWTYPLEFSALVHHPRGMDLAFHTPRFHALLLDLADVDDNDLGQDRVVRVLLQVLKYVQIRSPQALRPALSAIVGLRPIQSYRDTLAAIFEYLFQALPDRSPSSILEALPNDEVRREAMTIADRLKRTGRQEGRIEGKLQDKQEVLVRLLGRRFGVVEEDRKLIRSQADPAKLDRAIDAFVFADSKVAVLEHLDAAPQGKIRRPRTSSTTTERRKP